MALYIYSDLAQIADVDESLIDIDAQQSYCRPNPSFRENVPDIESFVRQNDSSIVIVEIPRHWIGRRYLRLLRLCLSLNRKVSIFWQGEDLIEQVNTKLVRKLRGQWLRQFLARQIAGGGAPPLSMNGGDVAGCNDIPAELSELQTVETHFQGAVDDLGGNLEGLHQTRLTAEHTQRQLMQTNVDLHTALERVRVFVANANDSIDETEIEQRQNDLKAALQSVSSVAESLQVIEQVMTNHKAYLDTGVTLLMDFMERGRTSGFPGARRLPATEIPKYIAQLEIAAKHATPVAFEPGIVGPSGAISIEGTGVYLRLDYWAPMVSGGSFGHTAYVVKELASRTTDFVCMMANPLPLIDEMGIRQVALPPSTRVASDIDILNTAEQYKDTLRPALSALRPAYIYERLSLGNTAGAILSRELAIPYIVEYNGSEMSLRRSFDGSTYEQEQAFLAVEALAFAQATLITVVSKHIKADLVERGVPAAKILVNPNCVDAEDYLPAKDSEKRALRRELDIPDDAIVVGFIGSFGGWHGIDILSETLHPIAAADSRIHFLLIGDGNFRHLIDDAIAQHQLEGRVTMTGRVPQTRGAELLRACDIFVSPHSSHMVDQKFFGSPTKLFEYLAMGGGVVASDLEQIGDVMRPSLTPEQLSAGKVSFTNERGVLCKPGDAESFIVAVTGLARRPDIIGALGANARKAVIDYYTWDRHVENFFYHMTGAPLVGYAADADKM
jgi:glycosyltransferase involved in cell wall biosynthesis